MSRRMFAVSLAVVLLAGCGSRPGGSSAGPTPIGGSSGAASGATPGGPAAGTTVHTVTVDGRSRTFRLYRPAGLPAGPVPLVVMMHGGLGSGEQAQTTYGWDARADAGGFVVAYPDGLNRAWVVSDGCCGRAVRDGVNDVAFISRVVATVSGRLSVDPARVYATGMSNGALLSYRLACDTDLFAAIGPVAGTQVGACPDPRPTSVIHVHGTADEHIPYRGGPSKLNNDGQGRVPVDIDGPAVPDLISRWHTVDRCAGPTTTTAGPVTTQTAACAEARAVTLITIAGAGHQWPGSRRGADAVSTAIDATAVIWDFFAAHPKP